MSSLQRRRFRETTASSRTGLESAEISPAPLNEPHPFPATQRAGKEGQGVTLRAGRKRAAISKTGQRWEVAKQCAGRYLEAWGSSWPPPGTKP